MLTNTADILVVYPQLLIASDYPPLIDKLTYPLQMRGALNALYPIKYIVAAAGTAGVINA